MTELPLRCACGKLHGTAFDASPETTTHAVCYCADCQAFARFLGGEGLMNEWGGSDIIQMALARVKLETSDTLACMRLGPNGLNRWYCADCKTPVANTRTPKHGFVGVCAPFFTATPDSVVGPPKGHVQTKNALNGGPPHAPHTLRVLGSMARRITTYIVKGLGRPSSFFDRDDKPVVTPRILTLDERKALYV